MNKIKILFATVHMEVGGIERTLIGLLNRIDYSKYDVDLLILKTDGVFLRDIPKQVNIIKPYKTKFMEKIVNSSNIFCKVIKHSLFNYYTGRFYSKKTKYDVAISYAGYYPFIDKIIANSNADKKMIWVHTDIKFIYQNNKQYRNRFNRTKNKYKKFDNIICVSESVKEHFNEILPGYNDKLKVMWNVIDNKENKNEYPIINGDKIIVSVGRICRQKRFDKLVSVHKKLIDSGYNVKTYLIGDGEEYSYIKELIVENNIENSFIMLGKQINVTGIVKQADLFVSTSDYEGLPTVLMETLICGVPFVAPDVCGINDIARFIAPKNSFILTENSIDSIYNGVVKAFEGGVDNNFKFDLDKYNSDTIKKFNDLVNNK